MQGYKRKGISVMVSCTGHAKNVMDSITVVKLNFQFANYDFFVLLADKFVVTVEPHLMDTPQQWTPTI